MYMAEECRNRTLGQKYRKMCLSLIPSGACTVAPMRSPATALSQPMCDIITCTLNFIDTT